MSANKGKKRTIVVAGNKTRELVSLSLMLKRFDYEVVALHSAAQIVGKTAAARPALIIASLNLTGIQGTDLFDLLKQDHRTASLPVIFLVSPGDVAAENRCYGIGAAGCISKPVKIDELYRAVQEAIEPRPRATIRLDTRLAVSLNNIPVPCTEEGCRIDLSENGIYIPLEQPYPRNERIAVQLRIKERTIDVDGVVQHNNAAGAGPHGAPGMGLRFVTISPQDQLLIRNFILEELAKDIQDELVRETSDIE